VQCSAAKCEAKKSVVNSMSRQDNIKMDPEKRIGNFGVDSSSSAYGTVRKSLKAVISTSIPQKAVNI
jgi:hypothetical protein